MSIGNIILKLEENNYLLQFNKVLRLCVFGYEQMIKKKEKDFTSYTETRITNHLKNKYLEIRENKLEFGLDDCSFIVGEEIADPETDETIGKLDISIIVPYSLGNENHYTIECKIIDDPKKYIDTKQDNIKKDSSRTNGIMSFIRGKYAGEMPIAGMIGFNKTGDIQKRIEKIKNFVDQRQKEGDMINIQNLEKYEITQNFEHSYKSSHQRDGELSNIDIYHLFFDFS
jgi:hypothetical protein